MTDQTTTPEQPKAVLSSAELGPFAYVNPAYLQTRQLGGVMTVTDYPGEVNTVPLYAQAALDAAVAAERERCAVAAWNHYLDTCRKFAKSPAMSNEWCASDAIRWPNAEAMQHAAKD